MVMKNVTKKIQKIPYLFLLMLFSFVTASAQKGITVRGTVLDSNGETIIGASVTLKGNSSINSSARAIHNTDYVFGMVGTNVLLITGSNCHLKIWWYGHLLYMIKCFT